MAFAFKLPTTSNLSFVGYISSTSHPSLPSTASIQRGIVRDVLKKHKRLPPQSQTLHLPTVKAALEEYIPYLLALDTGLRNAAPSSDEAIICTLEQEISVEWRATLTATLPGKEASRLKLQGLEADILFTLSALAYAHSLLARAALHTLYNAVTPDTAQRTSAITTSMSHLLSAHAIHSFLQPRCTSNSSSARVPVDVTQSLQGALASLSLASATLITVLKDDPYPAIVTQERNKADREWMYKAPDIPRVRAHLFARLCFAAAEHAAKGVAMLSGAKGKVDDQLMKYADGLKRTATAKAYRFFGLDADLGGRTGEGIAWLRAAKAELRFSSPIKDEQSMSSGIKARLKREWGERREDRRIERESEWGNDGGRYEEGRVLEMLEKKWAKEIETVNVQVVPPIAPLLASLPSGREYHDPQPWKPPRLDEAALAKMRAPPDLELANQGDGSDDSSDDQNEAVSGDPIGAFPGTKADYAGSSRYF